MWRTCIMSCIACKVSVYYMYSFLTFIYHRYWDLTLLPYFYGSNAYMHYTDTLHYLFTHTAVKWVITVTWVPFLPERTNTRFLQDFCFGIVLSRKTILAFLAITRDWVTPYLCACMHANMRHLDMWAYGASRDMRALDIWEHYWVPMQYLDIWEHYWVPMQYCMSIHACI
jgi:hypothetical protein